jgi:hypothetical protein
MFANHNRSGLGHAAVLVLTLAAALTIALPAALATNQAAAEGPQMQIGPPTLHVKNGKIAMKAVCPAEASACSGVILGRLPLPRKRGSALDPGSLGGPFFNLKPGETLPVVFRLTAKTKAFLKTHRKTTLQVTVKVSDAEHNETVSTTKLTLFAV